MKNKKIIIGVGIIVAGIVMLFLVLALRNSSPEVANEIDNITVQKDGNTLTVSRDGRVTFNQDGEFFEDFWDREKTDTFFGYIDGKYNGEGELVTGGQNYIIVSGSGGSTTYILDDDELIDAVEDETSGGDSGGSSGTGSSGGTTTSTPAPTGTSGGSSGSGGSNPECLYWRISYCVRPRTPSPVPSTTPPPTEIREPDCGDNTQTGKTVIGNDLCLTTPTPEPTP